MKILIVGSLSENAGDDQKHKFSLACQSIAKNIDKQKHELILCSEDIKTVDFQIINNLVKLKTSIKITFYYHQNKEAPFKHLINLNKNYKRIEGDSFSVRIPAIKEADCVIIIGGETNTSQVAQLCPYLDKILLPIPSFGGVSAKYWQSFESILTMEKNSRLTTLWDNIKTWEGEKSAEALLSIAKWIENKQKENKRKSSVTFGDISIFLVSLTFCLIWFISLKTPVFPPLIWLLISFSSAACIGSSARELTQYFEKTSYKLSWKRLILSYTLGILCGFCFFILYLGSGTVVTGKTNFLEMLENPGEYQRILVTISILSTGAGFMLNGISKKLQSKFESILS